METPHQKALNTLKMFSEIVNNMESAKSCAIMHIIGIIEYLNKNRRLTQCVIDEEFYRYVLIELNAL